MSYSILVGLNVVDQEMYKNYRLEMRPILISYGGDFGYDFIIDEVLKSKVSHPINRVFTIDFPSREEKETFFNDSRYLEVRKKYFEASVSNVTEITNF